MEKEIQRKGPVWEHPQFIPEHVRISTRERNNQKLEEVVAEHENAKSKMEDDRSRWNRKNAK